MYITPQAELDALNANLRNWTHYDFRELLPGDQFDSSEYEEFDSEACAWGAEVSCIKLEKEIPQGNAVMIVTGQIVRFSPTAKTVLHARKGVRNMKEFLTSSRQKHLERMLGYRR